MIGLFRDIKKQSRKILFENYKYLVLPALLLSFLNALKHLILNYLTIFPVWLNFSFLLRAVILLLFLLIEFVGIPISFALLFKTSICLINGESDLKTPIKKFLNLVNIRKIVLINLIPRLFAFISDINGAKTSSLNYLKLDSTISLIITLVGVIVSYKLFASDYYFASTECSVFDSLKTSCKIMKGKFGRYILLYFTFAIWGIAIGAVHILAKIVICGHSANAYTPFLDVFAISFGYGINLFLIPYMYLTFSLFISNLLKLDKE